MMMCFKNSVFGSCLMLTALICWFNAKSSEAFGTFGLDIHHRYSDTVKQFLNLDGLPKKGTMDYYTAMAHSDDVFKGRRLAASTPPIITFFSVDGNLTYSIPALSSLHYAYIRVGTPFLFFLVALDTGSDLFWLPCDCITCPRYFNTTTTGKRFELEIYSPSNSTTSTPLPCNSPLCGPTRGCLAKSNTCSYQQFYGTTSSTGVLVEDVLHFGTNTNPQDPIDVTVTFGCGKNQTGYFLESGGGINGVFGLGMGSISVPSILASKNITANSFSLCFALDGDGRIEFGDKGSPLQKTTPFNLQQSNPTYNITVTQVAVNNNLTNLEFTAIVRSRAAFSYFNEPTYSFIVNNFISRITEAPYKFPYEVVFEHCYALSANQSTYTAPNLTFTMKGGSIFNVTAPTFDFTRDEGGKGYCLAIINNTINIIGHNFMSGYRLVFDREEMVLGWKESDCYDSISPDPQPPPQGNSPRPRPPPQQQQPPPPPPNGAARLNSVTSGLMAVMLLAVFFHNFIVLSS